LGWERVCERRGGWDSPAKISPFSQFAHNKKKKNHTFEGDGNRKKLNRRFNPIEIENSIESEIKKFFSQAGFFRPFLRASTSPFLIFDPTTSFVPAGLSSPLSLARSPSLSHTLSHPSNAILSFRPS